MAIKIHASKAVVFTGFLILSLMFQFMPQRLTNHANFFFVRYFGPFLRIGRQFSAEKIRMSGANEITVPKVLYDSLWKNYKNLQARLESLNRDYQSVSKIRAALPMPASAIVIARTTSASRPARYELIINKGSDDGINTGHFVLSPTADSVVGIIKEVSDRMSRVQLITDLTGNFEVRIRRDGGGLDLPARLSGDGKNGCLIDLIPRDAGIRPADAVYAAAAAGRLEIPVIIGEVRQVSPDMQNPLLCRIIVQPVENPAQLDEVAVIIPPSVKNKKN